MTSVDLTTMTGLACVAHQMTVAATTPSVVMGVSYAHNLVPVFRPVATRIPPAICASKSALNHRQVLVQLEAPLP